MVNIQKEKEILNKTMLDIQAEQKMVNNQAKENKKMMVDIQKEKIIVDKEMVEIQNEKIMVDKTMLDIQAEKTMVYNQAEQNKKIMVDIEKEKIRLAMLDQQIKEHDLIKEYHIFLASFLTESASKLFYEVLRDNGFGISYYRDKDLVKERKDIIKKWVYNGVKDPFVTDEHRIQKYEREFETLQNEFFEALNTYQQQRQQAKKYKQQEEQKQQKQQQYQKEQTYSYLNDQRIQQNRLWNKRIQEQLQYEQQKQKEKQQHELQQKQEEKEKQQKDDDWRKRVSDQQQHIHQRQPQQLSQKDNKLPLWAWLPQLG